MCCCFLFFFLLASFGARSPANALFPPTPSLTFSSLLLYPGKMDWNQKTSTMKLPSLVTKLGTLFLLLTDPSKIFAQAVVVEANVDGYIQAAYWDLKVSRQGKSDTAMACVSHLSFLYLLKNATDLDPPLQDGTYVSIAIYHPERRQFRSTLAIKVIHGEGTILHIFITGIVFLCVSNQSRRWGTASLEM